MNFAQSQEDGSMPILAACFDPTTTNGSFWGPTNKMGSVGPAKMFEYDKGSLDKNSKDVLWKTSEEACGSFTI